MIVDWELPFRDGADGALAGRFQNLADWAAIPTSRFYSLCFSRQNDARTVAADVAVSRGVLPDDGVSIDGAGRQRAAARGRTTPTSSTCNSDSDVNGRTFCEVVNRWQYAQS